MECKSASSISKKMANKQRTAICHALRWADGIQNILHDMSSVALSSTKKELHDKSELDHFLKALCALLRYAVELTKNLAHRHEESAVPASPLSDTPDDAGGASKAEFGGGASTSEDLLGILRTQTNTLLYAVAKAEQVKNEIDAEYDAMASLHKTSPTTAGDAPSLTLSTSPTKRVSYLQRVLGLLQSTSSKITGLIDEDNAMSLSDLEKTDGVGDTDIISISDNLDGLVRHYVHNAIADHVSQLPYLSLTKAASTHSSLFAEEQRSPSSPRSCTHSCESTLSTPLLRIPTTRCETKPNVGVGGRAHVMLDNVRDMRGHAFADDERPFLNKRSAADLRCQKRDDLSPAPHATVPRRRDQEHHPPFQVAAAIAAAVMRDDDAHGARKSSSGPSVCRVPRGETAGTKTDNTRKNTPSKGKKVGHGSAPDRGAGLGSGEGTVSGENDKVVSADGMKSTVSGPSSPSGKSCSAKHHPPTTHTPDSWCGPSQSLTTVTSGTSVRKNGLRCSSGPRSCGKMLWNEVNERFGSVGPSQGRDSAATRVIAERTLAGGGSIVNHSVGGMLRSGSTLGFAHHSRLKVGNACGLFVDKEPNDAGCKNGAPGEDVHRIHDILGPYGAINRAQSGDSSLRGARGHLGTFRAVSSTASAYESGRDVLGLNGARGYAVPSSAERSFQKTMAGISRDVYARSGSCGATRTFHAALQARRDDTESNDAAMPRTGPHGAHFNHTSDLSGLSLSSIGRSLGSIPARCGVGSDGDCFSTLSDFGSTGRSVKGWPDPLGVSDVRGHLGAPGTGRNCNARTTGISDDVRGLSGSRNSAGSFNGLLPTDFSHAAARDGRVGFRPYRGGLHSLYGGGSGVYANACPTNTRHGDRVTLSNGGLQGAFRARDGSHAPLHERFLTTSTTGATCETGLRAHYGIMGANSPEKKLLNNLTGTADYVCSGDSAASKRSSLAERPYLMDVESVTKTVMGDGRATGDRTHCGSIGVRSSVGGSLTGVSVATRRYMCSTDGAASYSRPISGESRPITTRLNAFSGIHVPIATSRVAFSAGHRENATREVVGGAVEAAGDRLHGCMSGVCSSVGGSLEDGSLAKVSSVQNAASNSWPVSEEQRPMALENLTESTVDGVNVGPIAGDRAHFGTIGVDSSSRGLLNDGSIATATDARHDNSDRSSRSVSQGSRPIAKESRVESAKNGLDSGAASAVGDQKHSGVVGVSSSAGGSFNDVSAVLARSAQYENGDARSSRLFSGEPRPKTIECFAERGMHGSDVAYLSGDALDTHARSGRQHSNCSNTIDEVYGIHSISQGLHCGNSGAISESGNLGRVVADDASFCQAPSEVSAAGGAFERLYGEKKISREKNIKASSHPSSDLGAQSTSSTIRTPTMSPHTRPRTPLYASRRSNSYGQPDGEHVPSSPVVHAGRTRTSSDRLKSPPLVQHGSPRHSRNTSALFGSPSVTRVPARASEVTSGLSSSARIDFWGMSEVKKELRHSYDKCSALESRTDARVQDTQHREGPDGRPEVIVAPSPDVHAQTPTSRPLSDASHFSLDGRVQRLVDAFASLETAVAESAILSEIGGLPQVRKVTPSIQQKLSALESMFALHEEKQKSKLAKTDGGTRAGESREPQACRTIAETNGASSGDTAVECDNAIDEETLAKILSPIGKKAALSAVEEDEKRKEAETEKKEKEAVAESVKGKGKGPPPPANKGKGKGKGPPPPASKGKGKGKKGKEQNGTPEKKEEDIRKPELTPGVAMRPLFWNSFRIPRKTDEETVWHRIDRLDTGPTFSTEELERHFGVVEKGKTCHLAKRGSSSAVAQQKMRIFEEARRRQIVVMLRRLPNNFFPAILHMDDSILSADQVSLLLDNLPSPEELTLIARARASMLEDANEDPREVEWETAEMFIIELSSLPQFSLRLRLWHYLLVFDERFAFFESIHASMRDACHAVRDDEVLRDLLRYALSMGNYLNAGTHRGRADGFNVDILPQLKNVKSGGQEKGVQTLVDFLVAECERVSPSSIDTLFLPNGVLDVVSKAARFKLQDVRAELNGVISMGTSLSKQTNTHKLHDMDSLRVRGNALDAQCGRLQELYAAMNDTDSLFMEVKKYYEMDLEKTTEEFFGIWEIFLKDVKNSFEAHRARNNSKSSRRGLRRHNTACYSRERTVSPSGAEEKKEASVSQAPQPVAGEDDKRVRRCASLPMMRRKFKIAGERPPNNDDACSVADRRSPEGGNPSSPRQRSPSLREGNTTSPRQRGASPQEGNPASPQGEKGNS